MREFPIESAGPGIYGAELKFAIVDSCHWHHFGIVTGREDLVCCLQLLVRESFLDHFHAASLQEPNYALPCYAREESSVRDRCKNPPLLRHENVRCSEFGNISEHVADDSIVEPAGMSFKKRTRIIGIKASGLRIDRHGVERRPTIRRKHGRKALRRAHRSFINRQAPASRFGLMRLDPGSFLLGPIHWPYVQCGILVEFGYALSRQPDPGLRRNHRLQEELPRRTIHTCAMEVKVGRDTFEGTSTIKYHGAKPRGMCARTHDRDVPFVPMSFEVSPRLGPTFSTRHLAPPTLQMSS